MKRTSVGFTIFLFTILALGCASAAPAQTDSAPSPSHKEVTPQPGPTSRAISSPTSTLTPSNTVSPTAAPTEQATLAATSSQNSYQIATLGQFGKGVPRRVVFSPDGNYLAVASSTGIQIYDAATLTFVREYPSQSYPSSLVFSPDGNFLASGGRAVQLWDFASGELIHTLYEHTSRYGFGCTVAFSPDGKTLLSGGGEAAILWDVHTGEKLFSMYAGDDAVVTSVAFSPDGKTVAFGIFKTLQGVLEDDIIVWDVASERPINTIFHGDENIVIELHFLPDGKTLASNAKDRTIKLWDIFTGQELSNLNVESNLLRMAFSPDGKMMAVRGKEDAGFVLWDITTQQKEYLPSSIIGNITSITFSPDGNKLATTVSTFLEVWDFSTGELSAVDYQSGNGRAAIAPDGKTLATSGYGVTRLWDVATGDELHTFENASSISSIAFSPDGKTLAFGGNDDLVRIWDAATGEVLHTLSAHTNDVQSVAFSPDGIWLASGAWDSTARLWNVATGEEERVFVSSPSVVAFDEPASIISVSFSPDGKLLAAGLIDNRIIVWDVASGNEVLTFGDAEDNTEVKSVAFSPDGKILASGSSGSNQYPPQGPIGIRLWDITTSQEIELEGLSSLGVNSVVFSPDGNLLAAGLVDGTVKLIDTIHWKELATITGHTSTVMSLVFSADGKILISSSSDQTTRLWGIAP